MRSTPGGERECNADHNQITDSPAKIDDLDKLDWMHEPITNPPVSRIDLKFPQSLTLTVRKPKGVTIKDAMDTIYKKFKNKTLEVSLCFP